MTITVNDIKLKASERMTDNSDGGGMMSNTVITEGAENAIFPDISRLDRVYGKFNLRKVYPHVDTANTDTLLGAHCIIGDASDDADVALALTAATAADDERSDIKSHIESGNARFYSVFPLSADALNGDISISIDTPKIQIVPASSTTEQLTGQSIMPVRNVAKQPTAAVSVGYKINNQDTHLHDGGIYTLDFGRAIIPGSISIYDLYFSFNGTKTHTDISDADSSIFESIDYSNGILRLNGVYGLASSSHYAIVTVKLAEKKYRPNQSLNRIITSNNRSVNQSFDIATGSHNGSLEIRYFASGELRTVTADPITNNFVGDGSGSYTPSTGAVGLTLSHLPDMDSAINLTWQDDRWLISESNNLVWQPPAIEIDTGYYIYPGSFSTSILASDGFTVYNISDDGTGETVTSNWTAQYDYVNGLVRIIPRFKPLAGQTINFNCTDALTAYLPDNNYYAAVNYRAPASDNVLTVEINMTVDGQNQVYYAWNEGAVVYAINADGDKTNIGSFTFDTGSSVYSIASLSQSAIYNLPVPSTTLSVISYDSNGVAQYGNTAVTRSIGVINYRWIRANSGTPISGQSYITSTALSGRVLLPPGRTVDYAIIDYTNTGSVEIGNANNLSIASSDGVFFKLLDADTSSFGSISDSGEISLPIAGFTDAYLDRDINNVRLTNLRASKKDYAQSVAGIYGGSVNLDSFSATIATDGANIVANSDTLGDITGQNLTGHIDEKSGSFWMDTSGALWDAESSTYAVVVGAVVPIDPVIVGLDPTNLPTDGQVMAIQNGDAAVIHNTQVYTCPNPLNAGETINVGRTDLSLVKVWDANGVLVSSDKYSTNLTTGVVVFANPLDLTGYTEPLEIHHRIETMAQVLDVSSSGAITLNAPLVGDYPLSGSYVSSALLFGDINARVSALFDQSTWTSVWSDEQIGDEPLAEYDDVGYPIQLTNASAISQRWLIKFTSSTAFDVIGETVGTISTGTTGTVTSPTNPVTGSPYFAIPAAGWGSGWATGNCLRFNTTASHVPIWVVRSIRAGASVSAINNYGIEARGDIDA